MEAVSNSPTPLYRTEFDSRRNLPIRIADEARRPRMKGPKPQRWLARKPRTPSVKLRNPIVRGKRYVAEIKNPSPTVDRIPE